MDRDEFAKGPPPGGYYATFDEDGKPTGFYHEAVHGAKLVPEQVFHPGKTLRDFPTVTFEMVPNPDCKIPPEAVPITVEEWERWNGIEGD